MFTSQEKWQETCTDEQGIPDKTWTREKETNKRWKLGHVLQEGCKDAVWACRDGVRKTKAHLELHLAGDLKGKKKGFYKYFSSKRQIRGNMDPLLNGTEELVTKNMEKPRCSMRYLAWSLLVCLLSSVPNSGEQWENLEQRRLNFGRGESC